MYCIYGEALAVLLHGYQASIIRIESNNHNNTPPPLSFNLVSRYNNYISCMTRLQGAYVLELTR